MSLQQLKQYKVISFSISRRSIGMVILSLKDKDVGAEDPARKMQVDGSRLDIIDDMNEIETIKYLNTYFLGWDAAKFGTNNVVLNSQGRNNRYLAMVMTGLGFKVYHLRDEVGKNLYTSDTNRLWHDFPELAQKYQGNDFPELVIKNDQFINKLMEEKYYKDGEDGFSAEEIKAKANLLARKPMVHKEIRIALDNAVRFLGKLVAALPEDMPLVYRLPFGIAPKRPVDTKTFDEKYDTDDVSVVAGRE